MDFQAFLWYNMYNSDGNKFRDFGDVYFWSAIVHGCDGVLPTCVATALGVVSEQILQGRRFPIQSLLLQRGNCGRHS